MASERRHPAGPRPTRLLDADTHAVENPDAAAGGELAESPPKGVAGRRRRFFLEQGELPWLPVGEQAFLLWVLVVLVGVWVVVALALRFG